ncbi:MAG: HNH endonuclease, partial [Chloroflexi bacterium]|nr:HNH endonuclease [Chloroflexota bacterium]
ADSDCQDTRQEVLVAESQAAVSYATGRECRVESGSWTGPYTGTTFTDPGALDIDHMVPLANAHRSGGWAWDSARKAQFANDLGYENHLIAVQNSANRSKGSRGPDEWKPPNPDYWCEYAVDWIVIKSNWNLTATDEEAAALQVMLDTCPTPPTLTIRRVSPATPTPAATATAAPQPTATARPEAFHCHCRRVINDRTRCDQRYTTQGGPGFCHTGETHGSFNTWPSPH